MDAHEAEHGGLRAIVSRWSAEKYSRSTGLATDIPLLTVLEVIKNAGGMMPRFLVGGYFDRAEAKSQLRMPTVQYKLTGPSGFPYVGGLDERNLEALRTEVEGPTQTTAGVVITFCGSGIETAPFIVKIAGAMLCSILIAQQVESPIDLAALVRDAGAR